MKENSESHQKELFRKYLNDACTREELALLFDYLQQSVNREEYEEVLEDLWKRLSVDQSMNPAKADDIFRDIVNHPETSTERTRPAKQVWWGGTSQWRKIAAVFIGLFIVSAWAYQYMQEQDIITYSTAYGETQAFWLPDSSRVILNGNSSLTYHSGWEEKTRATGGREVWLEGEGYFEVREIMLEGNAIENTNKVKFTVHTSHLNVEVLGTAFDVHNHTDKTQVVLNSGKVKLNLLQDKQKQEEILMKPGEWVEFDAKENRVQQKVVNPVLYSSWKDQQLMFEDTPVSEIIQILEDRYGFEIHLEDKEIGTRKFTGKVGTQEIDLLLKALTSSFNLKITRNGNQITMQYQ